MRKVILTQFLSLDGVAEDADKFCTTWDDVVDAQGAAVIETQDAVILGRRTYDEWSEFWPGDGSQIEPFASFINKVPKYIATSTPLHRDWENATAIEGDLIPFVKDLKNSTGGDIGVHASITVAQTLLTAGVLDELHLCIAPAIMGQGRRLLDALPPARLELLRSVQTPSGYLTADYRVL